MFVIGEGSEEIPETKDFKERRKTELKTSDIHEYYIDNKLGDKVGLSLFLKILKAYNVAFMNKLFEGDKMKVFPSLGELMVIEIKRKDFIVHSETKDILPNTRAIDWGQTRKLNLRNDKGKLIRQFFTSNKQPDFYKIRWLRTFGNATNINNYKYIPNRMCKKQLPEQLEKDELVYLKYRDNTNYINSLKKTF